MYRSLIATATVVTVFFCATTAGAQQDTTHKGMPGMKMPAPTKPAKKATPKPKSVTKTGARATTTSKTAPKTTRKSTAASKPRPRPQTTKTQPHDTAHMAMPMPVDTGHAHHNPSPMQMRDTSRMHMRDTSHVHMQDSSHAQMPGIHGAHRDTMAMQMSMDGPLGISMERMGSGTTWIPDAVMLPARHAMVGQWSVMLHGFAFAQYDRQGGTRGRGQFGSLNWAMIMASRSVGAGHLQFRFMPSLDAATVGKCGYPLLLQSGETCNGQPLVDRQHPHDFFMELGALYERPLTSKFAMLLYAAPAGEPALGPVAFMHRPSAMDNPSAPLGHHWQDATHISFGVITAGLYTRTLRLEASAFNGIEPNEHRWDFDPIKINSYSTRLTINPDSSWSLTAGYGMIVHPETGDPNGKMHRLVASAMYGKRLGPDAQWATTLIYGANKERDWSSSALVESEMVLDRNNTLFGRAELVQKSADDLAVASLPADRLFNVGSASIGYIRELIRGRGATIGFGGSGTLNFVPATLEPSYGSRTPLGAMVFVRLRPYHSPHQMQGSSR
ncbi:MAG: hypothetical protein ACJ799_11225 [Gemmatimonadaceae bacterium]